MKQSKKHYQIDTQRLRFVPYTKDVIPTYHSWMQDEDMLYLTGSDPLTLDEEYANQQSWLEDEGKYTFIIKHDDKWIGDINLFFHPYLEANEAEIDVMIADKTCRGQGFAKEAVSMMLSFGFNQYKKNTFIAKIKEENEPSIQLFTKLGFKEIKRVKLFEEIHYSYTIDKPIMEYNIKELQL